jgi:non-heme chloroperoxidase
MSTSRSTTDSHMVRHGYVTTLEGVRLHYLEAGEGPHVLLVPGWTLTAALWEHQIEDLSRDHHVIALDHRGQGLSDAPRNGYRIAKLASDAHALIEALRLDDTTWIGHSMGCSVAWAYIEQYGPARLRQLVLLDQGASIIAQPHWHVVHAAKSGAVFGIDAITALVSQMVGPDASTARRNLLDQMWTRDFPAHERERVIEQSLCMKNEAASTLLFDHATKDWSDLLPSIQLPALVIGGHSSIFPAAAAAHVANLMPRSTLRIFEQSEHGSHLVFRENPVAVNHVIRGFIHDAGFAR